MKNKINKTMVIVQQTWKICLTSRKEKLSSIEEHNLSFLLK